MNNKLNWVKCQKCPGLIYLFDITVLYQTISPLYVDRLFSLYVFESAEAFYFTECLSVGLFFLLVAIVGTTVFLSAGVRSAPQGANHSNLVFLTWTMQLT